MQAKNQFSRRQIRIKIFQILYGLGGNSEQKLVDFRNIFTKNVSHSEVAFASLALYLVNLFEYSLIKANKDSSKYIQSGAIVTDTDLARLDFIEKIKNNPSFNAALKDNSIQFLFAEEELIKKTYNLLIETEEYKDFLTAKEDLQVLENLVLRAVEFTIEEGRLAHAFFDERFINWEDDIEIIARWVQLLIKQPHKMVFQNTLTQEKIDFAEELLKAYFEKQEQLNGLIKPKLKNWDADRVAVIDTILLRLGLAELLFFPEIPIKVSINEYIDIAKMYSTEQSGQFVNGVLDNLRKDLEKNGTLRKHS